MWLIQNVLKRQNKLFVERNEFDACFIAKCVTDKEEKDYKQLMCSVQKNIWNNYEIRKTYKKPTTSISFTTATPILTVTSAAAIGFFLQYAVSSINTTASRLIANCYEQLCWVQSLIYAKPCRFQTWSERLHFSK